MEPSSAVLVVERGGEQGVLICANLTSHRVPLHNAGRLFEYTARDPENLAADAFSPKDSTFCGKCLMSTEAGKYGGIRAVSSSVDELLPFELVIWSMEVAK